MKDNIAEYYSTGGIDKGFKYIDSNLDISDNVKNDMKQHNRAVNNFNVKTFDKTIYDPILKCYIYNSKPIRYKTFAIIIPLTNTNNFVVNPMYKYYNNEDNFEKNICNNGLNYICKDTNKLRFLIDSNDDINFNCQDNNYEQKDNFKASGFSNRNPLQKPETLTFSVNSKYNNPNQYIIDSNLNENNAKYEPSDWYLSNSDYKYRQQSNKINTKAVHNYFTISNSRHYKNFVTIDSDTPNQYPNIIYVNNQPVSNNPYNQYVTVDQDNISRVNNNNQFPIKSKITLLNVKPCTEINNAWLKKYANRVGSDFKVNNEFKIINSNPKSVKFDYIKYNPIIDELKTPSTNKPVNYFSTNAQGYCCNFMSRLPLPSYNFRESTEPHIQAKLSQDSDTKSNQKIFYTFTPTASTLENFATIANSSPYGSQLLTHENPIGRISLNTQRLLSTKRYIPSKSVPTVKITSYNKPIFNPNLKPNQNDHLTFSPTTIMSKYSTFLLPYQLSNSKWPYKISTRNILSNTKTYPNSIVFKSSKPLPILYSPELVTASHIPMESASTYSQPYSSNPKPNENKLYFTGTNKPVNYVSLNTQGHSNEFILQFPNSLPSYNIRDLTQPHVKPSQDSNEKSNGNKFYTFTPTLNFNQKINNNKVYTPTALTIPYNLPIPSNSKEYFNKIIAQMPVPLGSYNPHLSIKTKPSQSLNIFSTYKNNMATPYASLKSNDNKVYPFNPTAFENIETISHSSPYESQLITSKKHLDRFSLNPASIVTSPTSYSSPKPNENVLYSFTTTAPLYNNYKNNTIISSSSYLFPVSTKSPNKKPLNHISLSTRGYLDNFIPQLSSPLTSYNNPQFQSEILPSIEPSIPKKATHVSTISPPFNGKKPTLNYNNILDTVSVSEPAIIDSKFNDLMLLSKNPWATNKNQPCAIPLHFSSNGKVYSNKFIPQSELHNPTKLAAMPSLYKYKPITYSNQIPKKGYSFTPSTPGYVNSKYNTIQYLLPSKLLTSKNRPCTNPTTPCLYPDALGYQNNFIPESESLLTASDPQFYSQSKPFIAPNLPTQAAKLSPYKNNLPRLDFKQNINNNKVYYPTALTIPFNLPFNNRPRTRPIIHIPSNSQGCFNKIITQMPDVLRPYNPHFSTKIKPTQTLNIFSPYQNNIPTPYNSQKTYNFSPLNINSGFNAMTDDISPWQMSITNRPNKIPLDYFSSNAQEHSNNLNPKNILPLTSSNQRLPIAPQISIYPSQPANISPSYYNNYIKLLSSKKLYKNIPTNFIPFPSTNKISYYETASSYKLPKYLYQPCPKAFPHILPNKFIQHTLPSILYDPEISATSQEYTSINTKRAPKIFSPHKHNALDPNRKITKNEFYTLTTTTPSVVASNYDTIASTIPFQSQITEKRPCDHSLLNIKEFSTNFIPHFSLTSQNLQLSPEIQPFIKSSISTRPTEAANIFPSYNIYEPKSQNPKENERYIFPVTEPTMHFVSSPYQFPNTNYKSHRHSNNFTPQISVSSISYNPPLPTESTVPTRVGKTLSLNKYYATLDSSAKTNKNNKIAKITNPYILNTHPTIYIQNNETPNLITSNLNYKHTQPRDMFTTKGNLSSNEMYFILPSSNIQDGYPNNNNVSKWNPNRPDPGILTNITPITSNKLGKNFFVPLAKLSQTYPTSYTQSYDIPNHKTENFNYNQPDQSYFTLPSPNIQFGHPNIDYKYKWNPKPNPIKLADVTPPILNKIEENLFVPKGKITNPYLSNIIPSAYTQSYETPKYETNNLNYYQPDKSHFTISSPNIRFGHPNSVYISKWNLKPSGLSNFAQVTPITSNKIGEKLFVPKGITEYPYLSNMYPTAYTQSYDIPNHKTVNLKYNQPDNMFSTKCDLLSSPDQSYFPLSSPNIHPNIDYTSKRNEKHYNPANLAEFTPQILNNIGRNSFMPVAKITDPYLLNTNPTIYTQSYETPRHNAKKLNYKQSQPGNMLSTKSNFSPSPNQLCFTVSSPNIHSGYPIIHNKLKWNPKPSIMGNFAEITPTTSNEIKENLFDPKGKITNSYEIPNYKKNNLNNNKPGLFTTKSDSSPSPDQSDFPLTSPNVQMGHPNIYYVSKLDPSNPGILADVTPTTSNKIGKNLFKQEAKIKNPYIFNANPTIYTQCYKTPNHEIDNLNYKQTQPSNRLPPPNQFYLTLSSSTNVELDHPNNDNVSKLNPNHSNSGNLDDVTPKISNNIGKNLLMPVAKLIKPPMSNTYPTIYTKSYEIPGHDINNLNSEHPGNMFTDKYYLLPSPNQLYVTGSSRNIHFGHPNVDYVSKCNPKHLDPGIMTKITPTKTDKTGKNLFMPVAKLANTYPKAYTQNYEIPNHKTNHLNYNQPGQLHFTLSSPNTQFGHPNIDNKSKWNPKPSNLGNSAKIIPATSNKIGNNLFIPISQITNPCITNTYTTIGTQSYKTSNQETDNLNYQQSQPGNIFSTKTEDSATENISAPNKLIPNTLANPNKAFTTFDNPWVLLPAQTYDPNKFNSVFGNLMVSSPISSFRPTNSRIYEKPITSKTLSFSNFKSPSVIYNHQKGPNVNYQQNKIDSNRNNYWPYGLNENLQNLWSHRKPDTKGYPYVSNSADSNFKSDFATVTFNKPPSKEDRSFQPIPSQIQQKFYPSSDTMLTTNMLKYKTENPYVYPINLNPNNDKIGPLYWNHLKPRYNYYTNYNNLPAKSTKPYECQNTLNIQPILFKKPDAMRPLSNKEHISPLYKVYASPYSLKYTDPSIQYFSPTTSASNIKSDIPSWQYNFGFEPKTNSNPQNVQDIISQQSFYKYLPIYKITGIKTDNTPKPCINTNNRPIVSDPYIQYSKDHNIPINAINGRQNIQTEFLKPRYQTLVYDVNKLKPKTNYESFIINDTPNILSHPKITNQINKPIDNIKYSPVQYKQLEKSKMPTSNIKNRDNYCTKMNNPNFVPDSNNKYAKNRNTSPINIPINKGSMINAKPLWNSNSIPFSTSYNPNINHLHKNNKLKELTIPELSSPKPFCQYWIKSEKNPRPYNALENANSYLSNDNINANIQNPNKIDYPICKGYLGNGVINKPVVYYINDKSSREYSCNKRDPAKYKFSNTILDGKLFQNTKPDSFNNALGFASYFDGAILQTYNDNLYKGSYFQINPTSIVNPNKYITAKETGQNHEPSDSSPITINNYPTAKLFYATIGKNLGFKQNTNPQSVGGLISNKPQFHNNFNSKYSSSYVDMNKTPIMSILTNPKQANLESGYDLSPKFNEIDKPTIFYDTRKDLNEVAKNKFKNENLIRNLNKAGSPITINLGTMGIAKYEPDTFENQLTIKTCDPNIELKSWKSKLRVIKTYLVLEPEEFDVTNFVPIVKCNYNTDYEAIQDKAREMIINKYGGTVTVKYFNYYHPYAVLCDINSINLINNNFNILWPTYDGNFCGNRHSTVM
ncbi:unnamed protein product [Diatraea saccharalis]|uniref:Uncharacterized protein n=1 Tax=Diatraea saccharalis TaxID=40085 RepID=A0A9N9WH74_9NEOP|nr:unnamed protein product [Diatraea saccharalis]